jgi:hypothetical protein
MRRLNARRLAVAVVAMVLVFGVGVRAQSVDAVSLAVPVASASEPPLALTPAQTPRLRQVRALDERSRGFLEAGLRGSVTFRALVETIDASNVLVHVETATQSTQLPAAGVGDKRGAGRHRVLRIRLVVGWDSVSAVALLGHELRHTVEVAQAPDVVDLASFGRLFQAIGARSRCPALELACFETRAADAAGRLVLREMGRRRPSPDDVIALKP